MTMMMMMIRLDLNNNWNAVYFRKVVSDRRSVIVVERVANTIIVVLPFNIGRPTDSTARRRIPVITVHERRRRCYFHRIATVSSQLSLPGATMLLWVAELVAVVLLRILGYCTAETIRFD